ncbi:MAG: PilZ domain-containing protein [Desulfobulbaceae bacterium]|nr:PilZ domain-containing protein [Desulfobulbaceae bacterium]
MEIFTAFVNADNSTTLVCPACSTPKNISVASFKNKCHFLKVRCQCGNIFRVHLDFRQHYRRPTELPGIYVCLKPAGIRGGRMTVNDISLGGIAMTAPENHGLITGCQLSLSFTLDDRRKTQIQKKVIVRSVSGDFIGCQFIEKQAYEKEIGFYLKI